MRRSKSLPAQSFAGNYFTSGLPTLPGVKSRFSKNSRLSRRRKMLRKSVFSLFAAILLAATAARSAERPNFLFIYTDDQRWDALGVVQREQGDKARFPWFQ